jgi:hypothetical protein
LPAWPKADEYAAPSILPGSGVRPGNLKGIDSRRASGAEEAAGGIRNQFHHVIDVMPMIFDAIGRAARYQGLTLRHGDALPALPNNAAAQANPTLNNVIPESAAVTVHAKITAIEVTGAISM